MIDFASKSITRNGAMQRKFTTTILLFCLTAILLILGGCATERPRDIGNICAIFKQKPAWYSDANRSQRRWGVPTTTLMAIMWQESRFQHTVKPPREKLLGIIPWVRPSSAIGFSQATYATWWQYQEYTDNFAARRSNFKDAIDFVGWFSYLSHKKLGIPLNNTYELYLAYHEGRGGYAARSYRRKRWLINVSRRVQRQANRYHAQLVRCSRSLRHHSWF